MPYDDPILKELGGCFKAAGRFHHVSPDKGGHGEVPSLPGENIERKKKR